MVKQFDMLFSAVSIGIEDGTELTLRLIPAALFKNLIVIAEEEQPGDGAQHRVRLSVR
jgi:hypothetical protein